MFNELLKEAGEFGLYQKFLTFGFLPLTMTFVCVCNWAQIFILMRPPHRCKTHHNDTFWLSNDTTFIEETCTLKSTQYDSQINATSLNTEISDFALASNSTTETTGCPYGWVYDFSLMFPTFATEQNLVCSEAWKMYMIHASFYAGAIVGAILTGWIADKYGRKRAYQFCFLVNIMSDITTFFAPNVQAFAAARFFSSMGSSNLSTICFVLAMEFTGPQHRLKNLAVWSLTFTFASTIFPSIAYLLHNWRCILAITLIPSTTALVLSRFIPESASWLMTNGRLDETAELIHRVAKVNKRRLSMNYIKQKLEEKKKEAVKQIGKPKEKEKESKKSAMSLIESAVGLFGTPHMRKKTILLILLWMIANTCYIGNNLEVSNLPYPWYISYSIGGISELPANLICLFVADRIGRRWTNISFLLFGGVFGVIAGKFIKNHVLVLVLSMLARFCYAGGFDMSFTFSSESFPTVVRGRGVMLVRCFGGIATSLSPFIIYLSETDKLLPLVVLGVLSILGAILTLFLPETAQQYLPHTIEEGEEFGRNQAFCFCPFAQKRSQRKSNEEQGMQNVGFEEEQA